METQTHGNIIAHTIRPFITSGPLNDKDADKLIGKIAKAIDSGVEQEVIDRTHPPEIIGRIKQLLSALDYDKLGDYQAKCVLLVEKELKNYE